MHYLRNKPFRSVFVISITFLTLVTPYICLSVSSAQDTKEIVFPGEKNNSRVGSLNHLRRTYIIPSINYKMTYIPPGTFMMGSPLSEKGRFEDEHQHKVTLTKGFFLGVTEITRVQWKKVMGDKSSQHTDSRGNHPVDQVSWNECQKFIEKLNKLEKSRRYRMPTEAEWEYACRAGSGSAFTNGDISQIKCELDPNLDQVGWYCGNTKARTQPVAKKQPNAWGLYDMHGNAWEWCQDWYEPYPLVHDVDPKGPISGLSRVFRSGGWGLSARTCRAAFRDKYGPEIKCKRLGFRIVREADK